MLNTIKLSNLGPIEDFSWSDLGNINLIIGKNSTGKTLILKSIFSALKSMEEANKGDDNRNLSDILSEKVLWTFQPDKSKLGELVRKASDKPLSFEINADAGKLYYSFSKETEKQIRPSENTFSLPIDNNTIFIPSKEVISRYQIVLRAREKDKIFGFDECEYSLVKAMQYPSQAEFDNEVCKNASDVLTTIDKGKLEFDRNTDKWVFRDGNAQISMGLLSEGVRKIAVVERLLSNNYIKPGTVVLIDEIETHLHIELQRNVMGVLTTIFPNIQFVVTTHSPFILSNTENAVIYDLENNTLVKEGLTNVTYEGVVEGYFNADSLSNELREKFEAYKLLVSKDKISDKDIDTIIHLEHYLDKIPDYLAPKLTAEYSKLKLEFKSRSDL